ncbi:MAG: hypothetical protein AW07_01051 [Candidatus Accumulibacter sp. SK-11]|nr:MAG: hypothetical protein AW07_01051 [Candidatus Accumulibacter sp. SK-11]
MAPLARFIVPALSTCRVPLPESATPTLTVPAWARTRPLLTSADSVKLIVPPAPSAMMLPLLTSVCVPPMLSCWPIVPLWPRTVTPAAKVVVPLPSRSMRLPPPVLPRTMLPLPASVLVPSKPRMPFWLMLTVPLTVRPLFTRCRLLPTVLMSMTPLTVAAST